MTILEIFTTIDNQCDLSISSIDFVNKSEYLATEELKNVRDMVVKQAFLSVFTEWEHFLEHSTIAYVLGAPSINGHSPRCFISPKDEEHANKLIKGTSLYPDWSNMDAIINLEESLFEDGAPYKKTLQGFSSKYKEMKTIRNHIVHNSIKSRDQFDTLVRTALNASSVGISPTDFLLSKKRNKPLFYQLYISHIRNASKTIAEYSSVI